MKKLFSVLLILFLTVFAFGDPAGGTKVEFKNPDQAYAYAAKGPAVLFFYASWCPICKAAMADIDANMTKLADDITLIIVNYDTASQLKTKYGVTYQHTFVQVNENGDKIKAWSGGGVSKINSSVVRAK